VPTAASRQHLADIALEVAKVPCSSLGTTLIAALP
jgi:hypothetical protein